MNVVRVLASPPCLRQDWDQRAGDQGRRALARAPSGACPPRPVRAPRAQSSWRIRAVAGGLARVLGQGEVWSHQRQCWRILPGLFIGNFKDARDVEQLSKNNITHILSIHDSARPMLEGVKYLCSLIPAADSPSQNLARHFRESIKFIHECRLTGEGCLVHCLAGVSRSVTLVVAYIMTITDFGWEDALSVVRAARSCANPNMGFQRQLQDFEKHDVDQFRQWLKEEYGENSSQDLQEAKNLLSKYKEQAELQQNTGGRQWNNNFSSVPSLSYSNYTTET
ncbi:PREDICTED: LOW QUALITY PROTEIN: dual specificity protein phosphatase 22 [Pygoscelis adeliae]|uniref:LOW QUALITY PROTEIN: dual specificity protein phosphatase 22 n=1 Tax=Pygoscelis adeliae TaxID=9238 RepID=UPI0004F4D75E|nr:PREDICTED: LOW QUALITY PROTEIN: dual specificity protein phosphatase 22 [Pygoscelis adeliae]